VAMGKGVGPDIKSAKSKENGPRPTPSTKTRRWRTEVCAEHQVSRQSAHRLCTREEQLDLEHGSGRGLLGGFDADPMRRPRIRRVKDPL